MSRYSPLFVTSLLVLSSACGSDSAQPGQASERTTTLASSVLASGAVTGVPMAESAPTARESSERPVLERRDSPEAQRGSPEAQRGSAEARLGSPAAVLADTTDEDSGAAPDSAREVDPETEDSDAGPRDVDVDTAAADSAAGEPQVSPRERTLAWLAEGPGEDLPAPTARTGGGASVARLSLPEDPPRFVRPRALKGLYVSAWAAGSGTRSQALIDLATKTEVNALVIDLKDASGYVSHPTGVTTARDVGADQEIRIRDLIGLLERLQGAGIYPIARIVVVKDPLLIRARPEWAVQDTAGGVWVDSKGLVWANLHDRRVWEYHVELAKEAAAVGFPEIQWDYVRFADASREDRARAVYPGAEGRDRRHAVQAFLEYARAELEPSGVAMTLDVFGASTSVRNDVGIGQYWEAFVGSVDVALPMVYPSHYWPGSFGIEDPNGHPYEIVRAALVAGLQRSEAVEGAGAVRPWLQDFTLGPPRYEAPEVRAQIQATYDAGVSEWVLWNPSSRYTEGALAPADGYPVGFEPMMRVGGRIVPVSERYVAMEAESVERALARAVADSITAAEAADGPGPAHGPGPADARGPDDPRREAPASAGPRVPR